MLHSPALCFKGHDISFGSRALCVTAHKIWNSPPLHIRHLKSLSTFRCHLKVTQHFQSVYPIYRACPNSHWFCLRRLRRYISHLLTYLLTYFCIYGQLSDSPFRTSQDCCGSKTESPYSSYRKSSNGLARMRKCPNVRKWVETTTATTQPGWPI